MTTTAIIVAAGRGTRAGGDIPKQWQYLGGRSIAALAMQPFADHPRVAHLVLVLHPDDLASDLWRDTPTASVVAGGATRKDSVMAGLAAVPDTTTRV
ncbi:MAG: 2-C-methyl-D-erythritol 4-phosphate cytidylyltransferase, partial [Proteobacteria bacterium]|nr:2-C-methyl-D-erythritol 4-phosphate cytidylyltransferase [Pseudomonadota bacterium]